MEEMEGIADGISTLPEGILHHILSFLSTQEAVPTAVTCKRLNQVWNNLPCLDLGPRLFPLFPKRFLDCEDLDDDGELKFIEIETTDGIPDPTPDLIQFVKDLKEMKTKRDNLFTFVEQTLNRRKRQGLTLQKFSLEVSVMQVDISEHLDRWIHNLVECNIKELVLKVHEVGYDLPPILSTASSLCALTLINCRMLSLGPITTLRKLHLSRVHLDDKILRDIVNNCRKLEEFYIWYCHGLRRIIVSGLPQLKVFLIVVPYNHHEVVEEFEVQTMNLDKLSYMSPAMPCKINILTGVEANLKELRLHGVDIDSTWLSRLISKLPRLEELYLKKLNLKSINISSCSIKRLKLTNLFDFKAKAVSGEVVVNAPNLVYFSYTGCLSIVFVNKLGVKDVHLELDHIEENDTPEKLCSELMRVLQTFDYSETVTLNCKTVTLNCIYFEKIALPVKLNIFAPLAHVKHLIVQGSFETSYANVLGDLVYIMIRVSPNLDTLTIEGDYCDENEDAYPINLVIKFDSEVTGSGDCITFPWRCQRNCLTYMNVNFKSIGDDVENFGILRDYFMNNTMLIEEITGHHCKT